MSMKITPTSISGIIFAADSEVYTEVVVGSGQLKRGTSPVRSPEQHHRGERQAYPDRRHRQRLTKSVGLDVGFDGGRI